MFNAKLFVVKIRPRLLIQRLATLCAKLHVQVVLLLTKQITSASKTVVMIDKDSTVKVNVNTVLISQNEAQKIHSNAKPKLAVSNK